MSSITSIFKRLRVVPRDNEYLNRKIGSLGEIFFDKDTNTLRLFDGIETGGISLAKANLSNVSNQDFLAKATAAGVGSQGIGSADFELTLAADDSTVRTVTSGNVIQFTGGDGISTTSTADGEIVVTNTQNSFSSILVSGQNTVVANSLDSSLTFAAGANIAITTDIVNRVIQISATSEEGIVTNSFSTIEVSGQSNVVADSSADVLTLVAGSGMTITTNAGSDTITFTSTAGTLFSSLTDSNTASMTVDQFYLPAITKLRIYNSGASAYLTDQYPGSNPTIYAIGGTTIAFKLEATGHPFLIQDATGDNYDAGLVHVSTSGVVSLEENAQGKDSGTLYWKIPASISGTYRYQCSIHGAMVGSIIVKNIVSL